MDGLRSDHNLPRRALQSVNGLVQTQHLATFDELRDLGAWTRTEGGCRPDNHPFEVPDFQRSDNHSAGHRLRVADECATQNSIALRLGDLRTFVLTWPRPRASKEEASDTDEAWTSLVEAVALDRIPKQPFPKACKTVDQCDHFFGRANAKA